MSEGSFDRFRVGDASFLGLSLLPLLVAGVCVASCGTTPSGGNLFVDGGAGADDDATVAFDGGGACGPGACGGACSNKCDIGGKCTVATDCTSANCVSGLCKAPSSCTDGMKNGTESDIDCGGSCPNKCGQGSSCNASGDCATGHCEASLCDAPSCADTVKDGDETDVDCGGSCTKCPPSKVCAVAADCSSGVCTNKTCQVPSCTDTVKNGAESDVDCGGTCPACVLGKFCKSRSDCASAICSAVCVQCLEGTDCPSRICTNNACITPSATPPSCQGLAATCGANDNGDCCQSDTVTGGTFNRGYDGQTFNDNTNPATVSSFRLDHYEVTVGRFRQFVAAYPGNIPAAGDGANPSSAVDLGWDPNWTPNLPATSAALTASFATACMTQATWTSAPGANESKPINCLTWYVAYAFCIWDQGRLPTEAEWNYAAAGGSQQRVYPWPNSTPISPTLAWYGQNSYVEVGQFPAGAGLYGQLDMAGNVWEWTLDYTGAFPQPCADCANFTVSPTRTIHGGIQNPASSDIGPPAVPNVLMNGNRGAVDPANQAFDDGVRCARK